jgi:predicted XRE-type DNA-binding protein
MTHPPRTHRRAEVATERDWLDVRQLQFAVEVAMRQHGLSQRQASAAMDVPTPSLNELILHGRITARTLAKVLAWLEPDSLTARIVTRPAPEPAPPPPGDDVAGQLLSA